MRLTLRCCFAVDHGSVAVRRCDSVRPVMCGAHVGECHCKAPTWPGYHSDDAQPGLDRQGAVGPGPEERELDAALQHAELRGHGNVLL